MKAILTEEQYAKYETMRGRRPMKEGEAIPPKAGEPKSPQKGEKKEY